MIKDKSFSAYIFPIRDGKVALLKYGQNGYGPIGGRIDGNESLTDALKRELTEELGEGPTQILKTVTEISVPYCFKHLTLERAEKRGAWSEEHHFFITYETNNIDLQFCENREEQISVVWIDPKELLNPQITPIDSMRDFYKTYVLPKLS